MTKREIAIVLLAFCAGIVGQDKTTTLTSTTSLPTNTVRVADPDEQIAVGGRIITVREYMATFELLRAAIHEQLDLTVEETTCKTSPKFYVSFPYSTHVRAVCASNSLEAASKSGITVWTEEKWKEVEARRKP